MTCRPPTAETRPPPGREPADGLGPLAQPRVARPCFGPLPEFYLLTRVALPSDSPRAQTMMTNTATDASAVLQIGSTGLAAFDSNNQALDNMVKAFETGLSQGVIDPNLLNSSEDTIKEGVQQQQQLSNAMVHMLALYKNKTTSLAAAKTVLSNYIAAAHGFAAQDAAAKAAA